MSEWIRALHTSVEGKGMELIGIWRGSTAYIESLGKRSSFPNLNRAMCGSHSNEESKTVQRVCEKNCCLRSRAGKRNLFTTRDKEVKQSEEKVEELQQCYARQLEQIVKEHQQDGKTTKTSRWLRKKRLMKLEENKERVEKIYNGFPLFDLRRLKQKRKK